MLREIEGGRRCSGLRRAHSGRSGKVSPLIDPGEPTHLPGPASAHGTLGRGRRARALLFLPEAFGPFVLC